MKYYLRYFQPDGKGELKLDDGTVFLPNDTYELTKEISDCIIPLSLRISK